MKNKILYFPLLLLSLFLGAGALASCSPEDRGGDSQNGEFPIPHPQGGEITLDQWNGNSGHRTVRYPSESYDDLVAFYDNHAGGTAWSRSEVGEGPQPSVLYTNLDLGHTVDLGPPGDTVPDMVLLTLYVADHSTL